ncbi:STAS domain-containing protein [Aquipuribacter sp. MA13-6]|uniref:STAS domain-containing protein n=1 Tax=unclassified Aquipuribacter TaxID=2635084 RepID=UPI003EE83D3C
MTAHSTSTAEDTSRDLLREDRRYGSASLVDGAPPQVRLSWGGDLDIASAPVLASALQVLVDLRVRTVLLDVSAVAFMDCAGLSVLLDADARLEDGLRLVGPSSAVVRLLRLLDLSSRLPPSEAPAPATSIPGTVAVIEQSKGLIMAGYRCTADQAAKILLSTALRHNVQVQVLSALLVAVSSADLGHAHGGQARAVQRVIGSVDATA